MTKIANGNTANYKLEKQYIVLFNSRFNLSWNESDIKRYQEMWRAGLSEQEIANKFGCHIVEVSLFGICLTEQDKLTRRPKGLFGLQVTI